MEGVIGGDDGDDSDDGGGSDVSGDGLVSHVGLRCEANLPNLHRHACIHNPAALPLTSITSPLTHHTNLPLTAPVVHPMVPHRPDDTFTKVFFSILVPSPS